MNSPFTTRDSCLVILLQEAYDPQGKHLEFRDRDSALFARMEKVNPKGNFMALFDVFQSAKPIHAELRDTDNNLLLKTVGNLGDTRRDFRLQLHDADGTLLAYVYDDLFGVDFTLPDDTLLGTARRSEEDKYEPDVVVYTYKDATGKVVGAYERIFPNRDDSLWSFLANGAVAMGRPVQTVTMKPEETPLDPVLKTLLFLFPALQYLRYMKTHGS